MPRRHLAKPALHVGVTLLAFAAAACGTATSPGRTGAPTVVATTDVWGSVASAVAGDHAGVHSILNRANEDPHSYEATPSDAAAITDANLVVYNGGHYDQWADDVLLAHPAITAVGAYALTPKQSDGEPANEHVFYDLATAKAVAASIAEHLATDDPAQRRRLPRQRDRVRHRGRRDRRHPSTSHRAQAPRRGGRRHRTRRPLPAGRGGHRGPHPGAFAERRRRGQRPVPRRRRGDARPDQRPSRCRRSSSTSRPRRPSTSQIQDAAGKAGVPVVDVTETLPTVSITSAGSARPSEFGRSVGPCPRHER